MKYIVFILSLILTSSLYSQSLFESASGIEQKQSPKLNLDLSGYGRGSAYIGVDKYDFTTIFGEFALQAKVKHSNALLYSDIRFRNGFRFNDSFREFELKEAYAGYSGLKTDILLGNQIISWGRTDGFNPSNCITPSDFFFFSGDPDDQLKSNFMLRLKYRFSSKIEIDLIGIPIYKASNYRYDLFDYGEGVSFDDIILPKQKFENASLAARLNFDFSKVGFSLSCFRGYNPNYGFNIQQIDWSTGTPLITNAATPYQKNMLAADLETQLGPSIIRSEIAYNQTSDFENNMHIPNPDLHYVAGFEHSFGGFITIIQYIGKYTLEFSELQEPILTNPTNQQAQLQYVNDLIIYESKLFNRKQFYQQEELNHALALSLSKALFYDTWNIELAAYYNLTSEEYLLRSKISWNISDALTTSTGFIYMDGPEKGLFDYAGPVMNGIFLEFKVNF